MPTRYRFPSATNANLFRDTLDAYGVKHEGDDDLVEFDDMHDTDRIAGEATMCGGWNEPDPRSTIGAQPFTDLQSSSIRSNPPMVARGGVEPAAPQPIAARGIQTQWQGQPDGGGISRLETQMGAFPKRRSTRGQP
jgi:hypothetical protein